MPLSLIRAMVCSGVYTAHVSTLHANGTLVQIVCWVWQLLNADGCIGSGTVVRSFGSERWFLLQEPFVRDKLRVYFYNIFYLHVYPLSSEYRRLQRVPVVYLWIATADIQNATPLLNLVCRFVGYGGRSTSCAAFAVSVLVNKTNRSNKLNHQCPSDCQIWKHNEIHIIASYSFDFFNVFPFHSSFGCCLMYDLHLRKTVPFIMPTRFKVHLV